MPLFRPTRERYGPDPFYHWKASLFAIGGGFALAAFATGRDWLILVAIPILVAGVALRWLSGRGSSSQADESQPPDDPD